MLGLCTGCRGEGARARAEEAVLRRQTEGLRSLIALAEEGSLFSADQLAVGLGQDLVRDLVQAELPAEKVLSEELRVRLERAEVAFQANQTLVTLHGRVSHTYAPQTFADVTLKGGLHQLEVDAARGYLTARVVLDRFDVRRATAEGTDRELVRDLMEAAGGPGLTSLGDMIPAVEMPVRFDRTLEIKGFTGGPVSVAPARLPLRIAVAQVVPLEGRLWVMLVLADGP